MCDTCNVPLYIAESPRADQLRREIRALIARGETKAQVKATLKARYGPAILAMPEKQRLQPRRLPRADPRGGRAARAADRAPPALARGAPASPRRTARS